MEDEKRLVVAAGGDWRGWFEVFVHEACHMEQGILGSKHCRPEVSAAIRRLDRLSEGHRMKGASYHMDLIVMSKEHCEKRVLRHIGKWPKEKPL